jgi:hypothetical protein
MTEKYPSTKQRAALLAFAEACGTRASALRRDECSDWAIFGTRGHIYAVPEGSSDVLQRVPGPPPSSVYLLGGSPKTAMRRVE